MSGIFKTAGSACLVLQSVALPLSFANHASTVSITGGSHVPWSPCFHYLDLQWNHYIRKLGVDIKLELLRCGFYPKGGGVIKARIMPTDAFKAFDITERGRLEKIRGISFAANLDKSAAIRQKHRTELGLAQNSLAATIDIIDVPAVGKNTMLLLLAHFENSQCCYFSLGARGKRVEKVADEAVEQLLCFFSSDGAIDQFLADQLLIPIALSKQPCALKTSCITQHLLTNIEIIKNFLDITIKVKGKFNSAGVVEFEG